MGAMAGRCVNFTTHGNISQKNVSSDFHPALDAAIRTTCGMKSDEAILDFLLKLELKLPTEETKGEPITLPGLPEFIGQSEAFISKGCVRVKARRRNRVDAKTGAPFARFSVPQTI